MNKYTMVFALVLSASAFAHDEGHGPKLTDAAKQGGIVSPVIDAKEASKGAKASVVHKAELVRSEDGTVRVYLYDQEMNLLDLSKFEKSAKGVLEFKKSKKWVKTPFTFNQEEGAFVANAPKAGSKPFNIDVHVKEEGKELLAAFDNLD
jgi:hypothetical protein